MTRFFDFSQEPKLWYGIGILYDRYGSLEHAEEAFSSVIRMDPSESLLFALREIALLNLARLRVSFGVLQTLRRPTRSSSVSASSTSSSASRRRASR